MLQATQFALGRAIETYGRLLAHVCRVSRRVERAHVPEMEAHPLLE